MDPNDTTQNFSDPNGVNNVPGDASQQPPQSDLPPTNQPLTPNAEGSMNLPHNTPAVPQDNIPPAPPEQPIQQPQQTAAPSPVDPIQPIPQSPAQPVPQTPAQPGVQSPTQPTAPVTQPEPVQTQPIPSPKPAGMPETAPQPHYQETQPTIPAQPETVNTNPVVESQPSTMPQPEVQPQENLQTQETMPSQETSRNIESYMNPEVVSASHQQAAPATTDEEISTAAPSQDSAPQNVVDTRTGHEELHELTDNVDKLTAEADKEEQEFIEEVEKHHAN